MFYLIVQGGEVEAKAHAEEGFAMVAQLWNELMRTIRANGHGHRYKRNGAVDLWRYDHSERRGVRITWDRKRNQFMIHIGERMWESCYALRLHLEQLGFCLWDDMIMAGEDATGADWVQRMEATRAGSHEQRPIYLREPICLNAGEDSGPPVWRVGSVVCENQL